MFSESCDFDKNFQAFTSLLNSISFPSSKQKNLPSYSIRTKPTTPMKIEENLPRLSLNQRISNIFDPMVNETLPRLYTLINKPFDEKSRLSCRESFNCHQCNQIFKSSCSLGGHVSRVHSEKTRILRENALRRKAKKKNDNRLK